MKLGFLGCGVISSAVVRGLAGQGHEILVSRRSDATSAALAAEIEEVSVAENAEVVAGAEIVFLGLMAEHAADILYDLRFRPDQAVISFMAGADLDRVAELVAPARAAAVVMPFPGIAKGGSPLMALGDQTLLELLFGARNTVFMVEDTAELNAYLSAQAVLSPAVALVGQAAQWLAEHSSDPAQGEAFLRVLVGSSLLGSECAPLIEALNTPGGYNQRLRIHMEQSGMPEALTAGLDNLKT